MGSERETDSSSDPWIRTTLLVAASSGLVLGFARLTFAFVLEEMKNDLLGSYAVAGLLGATNLGAYLAGIIATNTWLRTRSPTLILLRGLIVTSAALVVVAASPSVAVVFGATVVVGFATGMVWIAAIPVVSAVAPESGRGLAYGLVFSGIGVGIAGAGLLVKICHEVLGPDSWRGPWLVDGALGFALVVAILVWLPSIGPPDSAASPIKLSPFAVPAGLSWALTMFFLYGLTHAEYTNYLVAAAQEGGNLSGGQATLALSAVGIGNILGGPVLGRLSDSWGRRAVLVAGMILMAGCAAAIPMHRLSLTLLSGGVYGVVMSGVPTVLTSAISDRLGVGEVATGYAAVTVAAGIGQLAGPPLGGWGADLTGSFTLPYLVAAAIAVAGAGAAARFPDRHLVEPKGSPDPAPGPQIA